MRKRIIVNADDYALSNKFNEGILELIEKNIVTSTTVMIEREFVDSESLLRFDDVAIGLHLELSEKTSEEEIVGQIEKFKNKFGQMPSHIDGHQHCHLTSKNIETVARVAKKYFLPVRSRYKKDREFLREYGIVTNDIFVSWHPKRKKEFWERLKKAFESSAKVIEIVCHPGYFDKNTSYRKYNRRREQELGILKSDEFLERIKKHRRISWNEV